MFFDPGTLIAVISELVDEDLPIYQCRDLGLLESALSAPLQSFGGEFLHETVFKKTAALWRSVTLNHPFVDGNKRMGLICCSAFLILNDYTLQVNTDELVEYCVSIATGERSVTEIAEWLMDHT